MKERQKNNSRMTTTITTMRITSTDIKNRRDKYQKKKNLSFQTNKLPRKPSTKLKQWRNPLNQTKLKPETEID